MIRQNLKRKLAAILSADVEGYSPDNLYAWQGLVVTYSLSGYKTEARSAAENVLRIEPRFTLEYLGKMLPFKSKTDTELVIDALRNAGLK